jgi:hypothetical protein
MGRTPRQKSRNRTYRRPFRGGDVESVKTKLASTAITDQNLTMINPKSKFVVATYWWGEKNVNRNLQKPCPEEITSEAKKEVLKKHVSEFPKTLKGIARALSEIEASHTLPKAKKELLILARNAWGEWQDSIFAKEDIKVELKAEQERVLARRRATTTAEVTSTVGALAQTVKKFEDNKGSLLRVDTSPKAQAVRREASRTLDRTKDRKFPEMIAEWKSYCKSANVNSIALHTEFDRNDYQHGINAKPLFIVKLLDYLRAKDPANPKGVLYIDGDMWVHKYPNLFDIEDVDFMARGWNIDPRSNTRSLTKPFFDPMIFETSGGTMYFGNTEGARRLLMAWAKAAEAQPGKADDRVLSQIFTVHNMIMKTNIINLPIEYLWLTDMYTEFLPAADRGADLTVNDAIIEHPYCLTGEERATDQGAAANRAPMRYEVEISDAVNYQRPSQLIYEYIMCNGNGAIQKELSAYTTYLKETKGGFSRVPLATVVSMDDKYGDFNAIADKNLAGLPAQVAPNGKTVSVASASIPEILAALRSGNNVWTGPSEAPNLPYPDVDCYATSISTVQDSANWYTDFVQVDANKPMFFAAKSPVLQHLLVMCETLADMNKHLKNSYLFLSRIRWAFVAKAPPA